MAITRLGGANAISGIIPIANGGSGRTVVTGNVLQVVTATHNTQFNTTSTSYVAVTGMEANITPSSTSSKILVMVTLSGRNTTAGKSLYTTIYRDDTTNLALGSTGFHSLYNVDASEYKNYSMHVLDSPSTTSSTNYQVYMLVDSSSNGGVMANTNTGVITLMEIAGWL